MLARSLNYMRQCIFNFESNALALLGLQRPPDGFSVVPIGECYPQNNTQSLGLIHDILNDSILWAVPKKRRSVEKRLNRKYGWPDQVWKPLVPKKNLLVCKNCGSNHEAGFLCPTCYSKVKEETEAIHQAIEAELGLNPLDKDVVVLYQGEKDGVPDEFHKGKRIIEMKKERPPWFSKNLLEKTTKGLATTTSVKPTDLA
ncbi:39S ribosomal protein L32, mitochondrial-like [Macrosteles quadrilineatus]|uniref:39S ribosomal protein L32, mitochondrial-like n=1 Tax=Macrosteles quadrilineatus TaxID=74068 RepID=UPI0023E2B335|nr:39S ribosomal protein L32, mitochondrial-like [Macrosteles quadrilineatus]XP_054280377.1 39S ribosomal protein L32, mitochondrial-like [Macrosteles quadrilineatus]